jgi:eukaryotic-like serine/threonine-protein kinase
MVGQVLSGRYELEELVGTGGMSSVYRAHDRLLARKVALKVLHEHYGSDEAYVERFRREARAVATLSHPNIVAVIDRGEHEGRQFIVFEYVEGENLKRLIERGGPMPVARALEVATQIARGLSFAHGQGLVHRDVKPQNVLLNGNGDAKVTDFGIARSLKVQHGMTQTGTVLGTSDYIAPEQAQGRRVDEHTDVYSLGIVLYELLTGEVPFKGDNQVAVAMKHVREDLPDVQLGRPEVSAALAAVVDGATAKHQENRYADDAELIADLEDVLAMEAARTGTASGEATTVLRTLPPHARRLVPYRLRHRVIAAVLTLLVAAGGAGLIVWLGTRTHHGSGNLPVKAPASASALRQVSLCGSCAFGFNPLGSPTYEHPDASLAIDNQLNTYWNTQTYYSGKLQKAGVGLYVDARPGTTARVLRIITDSPGFTATIYARNSQPPIRWPDPGWAQISATTTVARNTYDIRLTSGSTRYRYYLVWITSLGGHDILGLDEVTLYR